MRAAKKKALEKAGFVVGDIGDFLHLSAEEVALIDMKVRLLEMLRQVRREKGVTQQEIAKMIRSSQSRIAKMERGSPDVSLDLLCRALFALGVSRRRIARAMGGQRAA